MAKYTQATIHMPYIGVGIGGGSWEIIEGIINKHFTGIDVYVYEFEDTQSKSYIRNKMSYY